MYKVINLVDNHEIVILEQRWKKQFHLLRELDRNDRLVCPGCRQFVRIRAGRIRRWHFAHKHLGNCSLASQSYQLLEARAILYEWLTQQLGEESVTIEKALSDLPRPVDAWVDSGSGSFAYWIFDNRFSPEIRKILRKELEGKGIFMNWIFLSDLLHEEDAIPGRIHLSTTEREFMRTSLLDAASETAGDAPGQSLHYLQPASKILITYRGLQINHPPQRFNGRRISNDLSEITIDPISGDLIHPGEKERIHQYNQRITAAQSRIEKKQKFMNSYNRQKDGLSHELETKNIPSNSIDTGNEKPKSIDSAVNRGLTIREGKCKSCGKRTTEWVIYYGKSGECICRDCNARSIDSF